MRLLGPKATFATFRWDLVYLYASLDAEEELPDVKALAPSVLTLLENLKQERESYEDAENLLVIAYALRARRDRVVDATTIKVGGIARATDKATYAILFPTLNPSQITKLGISEQLQQNKRIAAELTALPEAHPLRKGYEADLNKDIVALEKADEGVDEAEVALALVRSKVRQFKIGVDKERLMIHASLVKIFSDKKAADLYFRPATTAPGETDDGNGEETAPEVTGG